MENVTTKKCTKCGQELPVTEFFRNKAAKDGLQHYCKKCQNEILKTSKKNKKINKLPDKEGCNPELAKFKPRELIEELRARGYTGTLTYTFKVTV